MIQSSAGAPAQLLDRMTTEEAAQYLRLSVSWLTKVRSHGKGPRYVRLGGRVFYRRSHLDEFLNGRIVETEDSRCAANL